MPTPKERRRAECTGTTTVGSLRRTTIELVFVSTGTQRTSTDEFRRKPASAQTRIASAKVAMYNMRVPTQAHQRRWDTQDLEGAQKLAALTHAPRGADLDSALWLRSCQHQRHLVPSSLASPAWELPDAALDASEQCSGGSSSRSPFHCPSASLRTRSEPHLVPRARAVFSCHSRCAIPICIVFAHYEPGQVPVDGASEGRRR